MNFFYIMHITIGEMATANKRKLLYKDLINRFKTAGFLSGFAFRSQEGIGENNDIRVFLMETAILNNLPVVIESIGNTNTMSPSLSENLCTMPHGQVFMMPAFGEDDLPCMKEQQYVLLKIYYAEGFKWTQSEKYRKIMSLLRQHHLLWSTAFLGIDGFGKGDREAKRTFFRRNSPVLIETVGKTTDIGALIPQIREIAPESTIVTIPVDLVFNK